ncbi:hypothetical protein FMUAM8_07370 [Nocardia cyriacigeorgica]|uniref:Uncharacterized protein n=1 Tax=Nocardia cyriacigeorgica (strain GUH-2) TaxID=1127134 RepID=H6QYZ6_NOCCG|nr:hypothetical protein FMUAM8_07370 [Nocardia cyriacigeorgica]CCF61551.1 protein of unknown function [Nocardia cyriacigeorgica GUH-2]
MGQAVKPAPDMRSPPTTRASPRRARYAVSTQQRHTPPFPTNEPNRISPGRTNIANDPNDTNTRQTGHLPLS